MYICVLLYIYIYIYKTLHIVRREILDLYNICLILCLCNKTFSMFNGSYCKLVQAHIYIYTHNHTS